VKNKKNIFINDLNGMDYKTIAEIITNEGYKINHSSARNYVIRGFMKIVKFIAEKYDSKLSDEQIYEIAKSPDFQLSIIEIMKEIYDEQNIIRTL